MTGAVTVLRKASLFIPLEPALAGGIIARGNHGCRGSASVALILAVPILFGCSRFTRVNFQKRATRFDICNRRDFVLLEGRLTSTLLLKEEKT